MTRITDDLKATADSIAADAERLAAVERDKTRRDEDDPAIGRLSERARELSDRIGAKVAIEQVLTDRRDNGPRSVS
jgi:hypothetical protein